MFKFYILLWFNWAWRLSLSTLFFGTLLSIVVTGIIYYKQGLATLNIDVYRALFDVFTFWFSILGNIALLFALFRSTKQIFSRCYNSYSLELLSCQSEGKVVLIENVGYGDLVKVWRKWFMLIIWLVGAQMIIAVILTTLLSMESIFSWFSIYLLYGFILIAGFFSFMILSAKCKRVRMVKC